MFESADVRSIDELRELHAQVCKFRTDAIDALAAVELTVRRAHDYLTEKLQFWQRAIRNCEDEVFQAKQELKQRQYPGYDGRIPDCTVQEEKVKKAQDRLQHAHEKVLIVRRWMTKLPNEVSETYEGPARQLGATIEGELPRGLAVLERRIVALEKYTAIMTPTAPREQAPPATEAEKKP